jgi:hypothetical protein
MAGTLASMENKNVPVIRKWGMVWEKSCKQYQDSEDRAESISSKVTLNPLQNEFEHGNVIVTMVIPKGILVEV